jgi:RecB family exonuclease
VWDELRDQSALHALTPEAERILLQKHWDAALAGTALAGAAWWSAGLRERERERTLELIAAVLRVDRARAPFTVSARESRVQWSNGAATLNLRIDRLDTLSDGARILLDYKSGATGRVKLQDGELEPLQLALYVAALAAQGQPVNAAALFSMKPGSVGLAGVTGKPDTDLQGLQEVADWDGMSSSWQHRLLQLLDEHLSGNAVLARRHADCRYCHLAALCRRAAVEDVELTDE